jgi:hypothetical protein
MNYFAIINLVKMKKEAKELVLRMYHSLKFSIPHHDLNDIFEGAKIAAKIACEKMQEEFPDRKEKYEDLFRAVDALDSKICYS